jgi:hypothetical protein
MSFHPEFVLSSQQQQQKAFSTAHKANNTANEAIKISTEIVKFSKFRPNFYFEFPFLAVPHQTAIRG